VTGAACQFVVPFGRAQRDYRFVATALKTRRATLHGKTLQGRKIVQHILCTSVALLALSFGVAAAQTATDSTTTQSTTMAPPLPAPAVAPPPPETLSTTHVHRAVDAYGNQVYSKSTTYRDPNGYARDTQTTTRTAMPPPPVTTTTTTQSESSGPPQR
jgi:hypothetical protein